MNGKFERELWLLYGVFIGIIIGGAGTWLWMMVLSPV